MDWTLITGNLLTPPILFFALGMAATLLRSDLEVPKPITRAISLYLLFAIGMHGGVELAAAGFAPAAFLPLGAGMVASAAFPLATSAVAPLRAKAEAAGSGDFSPLWSGQNPSGCREVSAAEMTRALCELI